jgi:3-hydroxyisobutyrate dehydrogenase-like beta-hydroxyacid dehydrogenase
LEKVGIIGLGNMGSAIAEKLNAQFNVIGFDIDANKRKEMSLIGIETCDSVQDLAGQVNVVILSMPKASISMSIVSDISPLMQEGAVIIETSTILPKEVEQLREISLKNNIKLLDAAILGGVGHMRSKSAGLLIGDSDHVLDEVMPVLEAISNE